MDIFLPLLSLYIMFFIFSIPIHFIAYYLICPYYNKLKMRGTKNWKVFLISTAIIALIASFTLIAIMLFWAFWGDLVYNKSIN